jgi:hypothetical protein
MRLQVPDPVSAAEQEQHQSLAADLTASVSAPSEHFSQAARRTGCLRPTGSALLRTAGQLAEKSSAAFFEDQRNPSADSQGRAD